MDGVLQVEVYLANMADHDVTVLSAPRRILNVEVPIVIYWYDLEGVGGKVIVPNPYELRPVRIPKGALALVERLYIPLKEIPAATRDQKHIEFKVVYEISPSVCAYLPVWAGKIKASIKIK